MWRWMLGGGAVLACLLYFLVVDGAGECDLLPLGQETSPDQTSESHSQSSRGTALPGPARPLRMRGEEALDADLAQTADEALGGVVTAERTQVSLATAFDNDEVNGGAQARERSLMIRSVVSELINKNLGSATVRDLECRAQHCRLQLAGDEQGALLKLVDALQDERGFYGKAESMMLSRVDEDVALYLRFPPAGETSLGSPNIP